jgi:protein-S-isoprenylcysteine O-methyltransferase Ste14
MFWLWRPLPTLVWSIETESMRILAWMLAGAGWGIVLISTFLISHFELFGLKQIWADFRDRALPVTTFRQPFFYRFVRHPIYTGFLTAFWAAPDMSQGHALFAAGMTLYILIGIRYEERDLKENLGDVYFEYTKRVGMIVPGIGKSRN